MDSQVQSGIPFGSRRITASEERRPFRIIGDDAMPVMEGIVQGGLARGDRFIIADSDGRLMDRFYQAGRDVVLSVNNPSIDMRKKITAARFDVLRAAKNPQEAREIFSSLIPDPGDYRSSIHPRDAPLYERTRVFLSEGVGKLVRQGRSNKINPGVRELDYFLEKAGPEELQSLLSGTRAEALLARENRAEFARIRSLAVQHTREVVHLGSKDGDSFSFDEWAKQAGAGGMVFIHDPESYLRRPRHLASTLFKAGMDAAVDRNPARSNPRIWVAADRLDLLRQIGGLPEALAGAERNDVRFVVGIQSLNTLYNNHKESYAKALADNTGNLAIAGAGWDEQDAKHLARLMTRESGKASVLAQQIATWDGASYFKSADDPKWERIVVHTATSDAAKTAAASLHAKSLVRPNPERGDIEDPPDKTGWYRGSWKAKIEQALGPEAAAKLDARRKGPKLQKMVTMDDYISHAGGRRGSLDADAGNLQDFSQQSTGLRQRVVRHYKRRAGLEKSSEAAAGQDKTAALSPGENTGAGNTPTRDDGGEHTF